MQVQTSLRAVEKLRLARLDVTFLCSQIYNDFSAETTDVSLSFKANVGHLVPAMSILTLSTCIFYGVSLVFGTLQICLHAQGNLLVGAGLFPIFASNVLT